MWNFLNEPEFSKYANNFGIFFSIFPKKFPEMCRIRILTQVIIIMIWTVDLYYVLLTTNKGIKCELKLQSSVFRKKTTRATSFVVY